METNEEILQMNLAIYNKLDSLHAVELERYFLELKNNSANPFNKFGKKCFSQTDEDGLTLEIVNRLNLKNGLYLEFGVEHGSECNSIILAALGWNGVWIGNENLVFDHTKSERLLYIQDWVTLENIIDNMNKGLTRFSQKKYDIISLDLDGNDIYFCQEILSNGFLPELFIVEYNGKFPPPICWQIAYNSQHVWQKDDYAGASLQSFVNLFAEYYYTLVVCNAYTGANAFFVKNEHLHLFPEVPNNISEIYFPLRLTPCFQGHRQSVMTLNNIFQIK